MKKIVKKFIALFLAIICCVGIVACKDDEIATGDSDGKVIEIELMLPGLEKDEKDIIVEGCLMNYYKSQMK
jgi:hypothetical protein